MKKAARVLLSAVIITAMIAALAACGEQTASKGVSVKTAAADKHKLETSVNIAGVLVPAQTVNIVGKLQGQVTGLNAEAGDSVKAGDVLITLDTKALDAQLQVAEAALLTVQNQADQAKINLDAVEKDYNKIRNLADAAAVTQDQIDQATTKYELAKKQYEAAAGAGKNQAQANINNIKVQLDNATITSPISGVVINRNINSGEVASPGTPLMTVADISTLKLKGTVPQEVVALLKEGQAINVTVDIYPNQQFSGLIESIGPMAVSTGGYFPVEISIKNPGDIRAGLSAHAELGMSAEDGVVVPIEAVIQNNGQNYVFTVKDNTAVKRVVTLGLKNDKEIQILKGLDAGEVVVTTNISSLSDNMPVNVN